MQKLIEGLVHFQTHVYPERKALFEKLAGGQSPEVVFITCSDSRVMPEMVLHADPGELFTIRNAGNFVPPHPDVASGVEGTVEYAIRAVNIKHIVVCGHTDCGAMKAALHPDKLTALPAVAKWLAYADRARAVTVEHASGKSEAEQLARVTQENVLAQMDNLRTYPSVAAKLGSGVTLHGWIIDIKDGTITGWNPQRHAWENIGSAPRGQRAPATDEVKHV